MDAVPVEAVDPEQPPHPREGTLAHNKPLCQPRVHLVVGSKAIQAAHGPGYSFGSSAGEKGLESSRQLPDQGPQRPGQQSKAGRGMSRGPRRRQ